MYIWYIITVFEFLKKILMKQELIFKKAFLN